MKINDNKDRLLGIELIRGIAAIWVLLFHYRELTPSNIIDFGLLNEFVSSGGKGVELFFVLSGFIMFYKYRNKFSKKIIFAEFFLYIVHRAARIFPLHIVTCLFMVFGAVAISILFDRDLSGTRFETYNIFGSLFLLSYYFDSIIDINMPAWTLSAEMFAYVMLPMFMFVCVRKRLLIILVCILGFYLFAYENNELHSPSYRLILGYCFGIISYWLLNRLDTNTSIFLSIVFFVVYIYTDMYISLLILYSLFVILSVQINDIFKRGGVSHLCYWCGRLSFPLYIVHWPVRTYIREIYEITGYQVNSWVLLFVYSFVALIVAFLGNVVIEVPARVYIISLYEKLIRKISFSERNENVS